MSALSPDEAKLVERLQGFVDACSGHDITLYEGHPAVLVGEAIAAIIRSAGERAEAQKARDEAQSMVQAWDHVFGAIEAHIMDRVNMRDPANPELYLQIIRGDIANIKRNSDQICAARWADYKRHESLAAQALRERDEAREALKPFARYCEELNGFLDNHNQPIPDEQGPGWVYVTIGDFRAAARALSEQPDKERT